MTKDEIIKTLRDRAKYPAVTLPRDCEALRAAADLLAQPAPVQEPVAWIYGPTGALFDVCPNDADEGEFLPLYTYPPQRTWVGLTDGVMCDIAIKHGLMSIDWIDFARDIEKALKEKNGL